MPYENDPDDPGGETKFGIDKRSHPDINIKTLTRQKAKEIYYSDYWLPVAADKLKPKTAWAVVDCGVNCGKGRAIKWLQESVGTRQDGIIGPLTIKAANELDDTDLARMIVNRREQYYKDLNKQARFKKFYKGWINRNESLRRIITNNSVN